jgi:hypothetical protein
MAVCMPPFFINLFLENTMNKQQYKVTNITVRPPKIDPETKKDTRSATDRVGHPVAFKDGAERITLGPNRPVIVNEINEGLRRLASGSRPYVKIEPIENIMTALKDHTLGSKGRMELNQDRLFEDSDIRINRRAKAVEMGKDSHDQKSTSEYEGAVNPDGDPNFLVKAPREGKKRQRNQR